MIGPSKLSGARSPGRPGPAKRIATVKPNGFVISTYGKRNIVIGKKVWMRVPVKLFERLLGLEKDVKAALNFPDILRSKTSWEEDCTQQVTRVTVDMLIIERLAAGSRHKDDIMAVFSKARSELYKKGSMKGVAFMTLEEGKEEVKRSLAAFIRRELNRA